MLAPDGVAGFFAPPLWRRYFDGSYDQALVGVGGAATGTCRVTAATDEGLVGFQKAVQWTRRILAQTIAQLVRHGPGRLIRHGEFPLQKLSRDATLVAAHQIGGEKPLGQIGSCPVKNRSSGRRFLSVAGRTHTPEGAPSAATPGVRRIRHRQIRRPAQPGQVFDTLLLGPKLHHKLSQPSH